MSGLLYQNPAGLPSGSNFEEDEDHYNARKNTNNEEINDNYGYTDNDGKQ